jgi:anaerobic selenocysteine-containing dehydrogenase
MPTAYRTCHLCEAMCGLVLTTDGERVTAVRGDPDDPFSRGHLCPKGAAIGELRDDPDRLTAPKIRCDDGTFRDASWQEALDLVGDRLAALRAEHGADAIAVYFGNPTVHNHGAVLLAGALAGAIGTRNRYDANSLDGNPRLLACQLLYGDATALPVPDVDNTDFLLMLGANPAASNGSLMTLGDVRGRLSGLAKRGATFVLVDPRRTETADWATEHVFIRPGTDAVFVLSLIHVILRGGRYEPERVRAVANGLDTLLAAARPFGPERAAVVTGIPAHDLIRLAYAFAGAKRAVAYGRIGTSLQEHGTVASWAIDALNILTGRLDAPGGLMFPEPPVDFSALARLLDLPGYARWRSRVKGLPELLGQLPIATLPDEIETPGTGQVRAVICVAGNPVRSAPDSARFERTFAQLELLVCVDTYLNETSRLAHVILPPADALERSHMDVVLQSVAVRNVARYSPPVFPQRANTRHDWEILSELGQRLGGLRFRGPALQWLTRSATALGLRPTPDGIIDLLLRLGPYGAGLFPPRAGLSLAALQALPHGKDLGPLRPGGRQRRVVHTDHRVDLVPALIATEVRRLATTLDGDLDSDAESASGGAADHPLRLIGRRHLRSNNSWLHNLPSLMTGKDRTALLMNPADAAARGLTTGESVVVQSHVGAVTAALQVTDDVMAGVVSLPHGWGHAAVHSTLRVAGRVETPNMNALTDSTRLDRLTGTAALNGTPVRVCRATKAA